MLIDLTEAFNFVHSVWDFTGVLFAIGVGIAIPILLVFASIIKISESKLENNKNK